jgi:hypothetical protein
VAKEKDGQAKDHHRHKVLAVRTPEGVRLAIGALADRERRSVAQMALILLEEALAARGEVIPDVPVAPAKKRGRPKKQQEG